MKLKLCHDHLLLSDASRRRIRIKPSGYLISCRQIRRRIFEHLELYVELQFKDLLLFVLYPLVYKVNPLLEKLILVYQQLLVLFQLAQIRANGRRSSRTSRVISEQLLMKLTYQRLFGAYQSQILVDLLDQDKVLAQCVHFFRVEFGQIRYFLLVLFGRFCRFRLLLLLFEFDFSLVFQFFHLNEFIGDLVKCLLFGFISFVCYFSFE